MRKKKFSITQLILTVFMLLLTLTMIVPLLHILARSLSDPLQSAGMSSLEVIPRGFSLINYQVLFSNKTLVPSIFNSIFITVVGTFLNIVLTALAAYVLTRPGLVGKRVLMVFFIIMMLFDPGIVPEYMTVKKIGLMGSQWSVILCMAVNVYYLVIMMRYFEDVPVSLCEAAKIDGANTFQRYFFITLPLCQPVLLYVMSQVFISYWGDYYGPMVYCDGEKIRTLAQVVYYSTNSTDRVGSIKDNIVMAGAVFMSIIPTIIFAIFQKQLIEGVSMSGIKG